MVIPMDCCVAELPLFMAIFYPILMAVSVLSFEFPELLNIIFPVVKEVSRQEILMFPVGDVITPERAIANEKLACVVVAVADAIIVVPSHNLNRNPAAPAVSSTVTVPDTNHVPAVP